MIKTPLTWIANGIRFLLSPITRTRTPEQLERSRQSQRDKLKDDADPLGGDGAEGDDGFSGGFDGDGDGNGSGGNGH